MNISQYINYKFKLLYNIYVNINFSAFSGNNLDTYTSSLFPLNSDKLIIF